MNLSRPPRVPAWFVVPIGVSFGFGLLYAAWALVKTVAAVVPRMQCGGPAAATVWLAVAAGVVEAVIGLGIAAPPPVSRRFAALAGTGVNTGLIGFAVVADGRGVDVEGCGCFGGIALPWPAHAAIAATLALAFLAILLDAERRLVETGRRA